MGRRAYASEALRCCFALVQGIGLWSRVDLVCQAMARGWLLGPGQIMSFAAPMGRCHLVLVLVVLHVLDAIEAFGRRWLSGSPSDGVELGCEFDYVVLDLIWLEWPF